MKDIQTHTRVNDILLGPLERPALKWLAEHMPDWITPDRLTFVGVLGAITIFASYSLTNLSPYFLWLASLGFIVNWFGDSLDGTLARHREIQRPIYGFFIDHIVDSVNEVMVFLGLGLSPYMRFEIACLALIGYLLMSVLVYVDTCVSGVFKISYSRLGPTELRVIAIFVNTAVFFAGSRALENVIGPFTMFDLVGIVIAALLGVFFIVSSARRGRELSKVDPS